MTATATIEHFHALTADPDAVHAIIERDGAVILEGLLSAEVVARVNDEVGAVLDAADPDAELFNPIMKAFHGPCTKQVTGACAISPTFATEVMCHPLLLALCDRILLPSCARYQLNLGHLLQRGPGADEQLLHRDEAVWSDVPKPAPELQLATVIAFVDFTRENGGTRIVPGSHRWPDRSLSPAEQFAHPPPRRSRLRTRRCPPALLWSTRAEPSMPEGPTPPRSLAGGRTSATASGGCGPRRTTTWRSRRRSQPSSPAKPRNCSATPFTTASLVAAATSAWCACKTRSSSSAGHEL